MKKIIVFICLIGYLNSFAQNTNLKHLKVMELLGEDGGKCISLNYENINLNLRIYAANLDEGPNNTFYWPNELPPLYIQVTVKDYHEYFGPVENFLFSDSYGYVYSENLISIPSESIISQFENFISPNCEESEVEIEFTLVTQISNLEYIKYPINENMINDPSGVFYFEKIPPGEHGEEDFTTLNKKLLFCCPDLDNQNNGDICLNDFYFEPNNTINESYFLSGGKSNYSKSAIICSEVDYDWYSFEHYRFALLLNNQLYNGFIYDQDGRSIDNPYIGGELKMFYFYIDKEILGGVGSYEFQILDPLFWYREKFDNHNSGKIIIAPNPIKQGTELFLHNIENEVKIDIYSISGDFIRSESNNKFNIGNLCQGTYILRIISGRDYWVEKLLVY